MDKQTKFITTTGILIALTIVFQSLSKFIPLGPYGNFITGSLVNACLLISASLVGVLGGGIIGIITPFVALLTGTAVPLLFTPFIALGNFSLVLGFSLLKNNKWMRYIIPAIVKTIILYASISIMLNVLTLPVAQATMLVYLFSWPQLVTALIGGTIASIVTYRLKKVPATN